MHTHTHTHTHTWMYLEREHSGCTRDGVTPGNDMYVYVCICVYKYMHVCICMCMHVYVCACMCIYVHMAREGAKDIILCFTYSV